jgi:hypothetical protein
MGLIGEIIALFLVAIPIVSENSEKQEPEDSLFAEISAKMGLPNLTSSKGSMWKKDGIKICLFNQGTITNRLRITIPLTKEQNNSKELMCLGFHNQLLSTLTIKGTSWEDITEVVTNL